VVADGINFADVAGAEMLMREARRRRRMGGGLYLLGVKERTFEMLRAGGYLDEIGEENVFDSRSDALEQIIGRLDKTVCGRCGGSVFAECASAVPAKAAGHRPAAVEIEAMMAAAAFAEAGEVETARRILAGGGRDGSAERKGERRG
jgi:hypothetical protein